MLTSLNQVLDKIREFTDNHAFINSFGYGEIADISTSTATIYPMCYATHTQSSTIQLNGRQMLPELSLTILMMDRINDLTPPSTENGANSSNQEDVMSDMFQLQQDLLFYLQTAFSGGAITASANLIPIFDDTVDYAAGWSMTITIKLQYQNCSIPNV